MNTSSAMNICDMCCKLSIVFLPAAVLDLKVSNCCEKRSAKQPIFENLPFPMCMKRSSPMRIWNGLRLVIGMSNMCKCMVLKFLQCLQSKITVIMNASGRGL